MAIRYAGDVEIRMAWTGKRFDVKFSAPGTRGEGTLTLQECGLSQKDRIGTPESYDKVAERVLAFLRAKGVKAGPLRRTFQAPCPIRS
jgi:hypothetical protein